MLEHNKVAIGLTNVYPNPTNGDLYIGYSVEKAGDVTFTLTDAIGQLIFTQHQTALQGMNNTQFDLADYPAGVYFIQLDQQGVKRTVRKVVKQ
jgi:hypothetical protein